MNMFWIGCLVGVVSMQVIAMLAVVAIALLPRPVEELECICCDKPIIRKHDAHAVPGVIVWAKSTAHSLTRRHRINHKAWVKAGKPCIGWKPVA